MNMGVHARTQQSTKNHAAPVRALIVLTATAPSLGVLVFFPHSGVVTDSYAASDNWVAPIIASLFFVLSAALEYYALERYEGLMASPFYALAIVSTTSLSLTQRGVEDCNAQCVLHRVAVVLLGVVELALLWQRGIGTIILSVTAVCFVTTITLYLTAVQDGGANVSASEMDEMLKLTGVFEICLLLWVRLLAASLPPKGCQELVDIVCYGKLCK